MDFVSKHCYNGRVDYYKHFFRIRFRSLARFRFLFRRIDDVTLIFFSSYSRFVLLKFVQNIYYPIQSDKWA